MTFLWKSRIIKFEVGIILTETLIILDTTKTESNNCFITHRTHFLFSDWPKAYSEFSKAAPVTSSGNHGAWFLRVIISSSSALMCCLPSVKEQKHDFHCFVVQCVIKQLLHSVFVTSTLIKVSTGLIAFRYHKNLIQYFTVRYGPIRKEMKWIQWIIMLIIALIAAKAQMSLLITRNSVFRSYILIY